MLNHQHAFLQTPATKAAGWCRTRLSIAIILATSLYGGSALATPAESVTEPPELFLLLEEDQALPNHALAATPPGHYRVRLNPLLGNAVRPPPPIRLSLPGGAQYEVIWDNQMTHPSGSVTKIGYLKNYGTDYRVVITTRQGQSSGRILTPGGALQIESDDTGTWLIDSQQAGLLSPGGSYNDTLIPPHAQPPDQNLPTRRLSPRSTGEAVLQLQAASSTIDVLLLYTPGMVSHYGSGLQARLDSLIALANQAYLDSQVGITLRLVHSTQVNYSETTSNETALYALTDGTDPALAGVGAWRNQYGADLVSLLRPFNQATHEGCGIAWVNQFNNPTLDAGYGYSVVGDGNDTQGSNYYCQMLTLTHELGHNMGSVHDRGHAGSPGAYPYSYGYGFEGVFGTIMSYINPTVGKFSNPNISCPGSQACGVADNADNARSLNNTRAAVASFKATQIVDPPPPTPPPPTGSTLLTNISTRGWVGTGDSVMIGGFILSGSVAKNVLIIAKGPALAEANVPSTLNDPNLTLYNASGQVVFSNDNWGTSANAAAIQAHPAHPRYAQEAAILTTLTPGVYTAIVRGAGSTTGNALVEIYDLEASNTASRLINISTRGWVGTGDSVMIGGFIINGSGTKQVLITAKGPALTEANVPSALNDPNLTLYNASGVVVFSNDNWGTAANAAQIQAHPAHPRYAQEAAILTTLNSGAYTAIVRGAGSTTGNALIEVYEVVQ
jgi:hypothetical protein